MTGNPYHNLANHRLPAMPQQRCRVIKAGWYGPDRAPVTVDQLITLPLDEAQVARGLQRCVFVP
jgi:hypothetical protein